MSLPVLSPADARRLCDGGALLVDIREADEFARERIPGARHLPLSLLDRAEFAPPPGAAVIFLCRSGARTAGNAARLAARARGAAGVYLLAGGLDAWKKAGLPVAADRGRPLELQRQVQIAAGALALGGSLLGLVVSPWFLVVPAFVGAGLITAGVTGFCAMARLLLRMPWNRDLRGACPPAA
ncbi:rhodanese-like domain-containing protein [Chelatococcus sp. SYSU_G07232]|uniref:Rhodanese-like domain-containing protein n=1 Tax=Chelatococcus albus TaxID=3047466 RepID=A0ABT7AHV8_9HYPH|nr:rhodanese-like domain-containing protein [Chelatococcus sp. SYSU_G07232]MDJ1158970.1 rhodanese-like domain-containing protein [Chelatococcus sp. SYSU_G07232]